MVKVNCQYTAYKGRISHSSNLANTTDLVIMVWHFSNRLQQTNARAKKPVELGLWIHVNAVTRPPTTVSCSLLEFIYKMTRLYNACFRN